MPYIPNGGVRRHYHWKPGGPAAGDKPPLLLRHGFMQALADWETAVMSRP